MSEPASSSRRTLALALQIPLLAALAALAVLSVLLIASGARAGVLRSGALSAVFLFFLGRRCLFLYKGTEPAMFRDIVLPAIADVLLLVILIARFS